MSERYIVDTDDGMDLLLEGVAKLEDRPLDGREGYFPFLALPFVTPCRTATSINPVPPANFPFRTGLREAFCCRENTRTVSSRQ